MSVPLLPAGLEQAFTVASAELGMATASWLFSDAVGDRGGRAAVELLRDELGRTFPVLDAVCRGWLAGARAAPIDAGPVLEVLRNVSRVVVIGLEAAHLDALVDTSGPSLRIGLLRTTEFEPSWPRVLANQAGRVELVELADFQRWAGARSALLAFVYGVTGDATFTVPSWLRVMGPDVRAQFRSFVGWEVLRMPLSVYPRWLVQVETATFTELV